MTGMKCTLLGVCAALVVSAADLHWLDSVAPIITPAERKAYLALPVADRPSFEETFWAARSIGREEYDRRMAYIDGQFGSSKRGSGANTDPGRVYLALGAPSKITRVPSSRTFVPLEIWYYDSVPGYLSTELRLIFYQPRSLGLLKLYSPAVDTIRALLLPSASNVHMFGPNDSVAESDVRRYLKTGPAEDEVITAAASVASGIKYSGNEEVLGQVMSPEWMLAKRRPTLVTSRFLTGHPPLDILRSPSFAGASQVDLRLLADARSEIAIEVEQGTDTIYHHRLSLSFRTLTPVEYTHRLDLLPGAYRLIVSVDSKTFAYPLEVSGTASMGDILRVDRSAPGGGRSTPFSFEGRQFFVDPAGGVALVPVPRPGKVTWIVREGWRIVWRSTVDADTVATVDLPSLPAGVYRLEAATADDSRTTDFTVPASSVEAKRTLVSFNANLAPAQRLAFIGEQWLVRGSLARAREVLAASLAKGETKDGQIAMARLDAISGSLDAARDRVRAVLARHPDDFEALAVFAYIETKFQDYPVAAEFYRKALAVQDSPALRMALAKLPTP